MNVITGDLLKLANEGQFDVIVHQCNCFHNFGAGIAVGVMRYFPQAFEADKTTAFGDRNKMGTISTCNVQSNNLKYHFWIVNGYSQFGCGANQVRTEYEHVRSVFKRIKEAFPPSVRIGYPLYGAGLAGGDWNIISKIIDEELEGYNHTLVKWDRK